MIKLLVLVDFDNLADNQQSNLQLYIEKIIVSVLAHLESGVKIWCQVRLYGGWYEHNTSTKRAIELDGKYSNPLIGTVPHNDTFCQYFTDIKLARALLSIPNKDFWNTYRKKQRIVKGLIIADQVKQCNFPDNTMMNLKKILKTGKCPHTECEKNNDQPIIFRSEQKMVDTMLSCDLIDSALINPSADYVIVVSSDDDFIPPLVLSSNTRSTKLVRVLTKRTNMKEDIVDVSSGWIEWEID